MDFLPVPQKLTYGEGVFPLRFYTRIVLTNTAPTALLYAQMLQNDLRKYAGLETDITCGKPFDFDIALSIDTQLPENTYRISISPEAALVRAGGDEALLNAVQTLGQWIQRHGLRLPSIEIEDWPDLPNRGYYLDCSRGRVPTLDMLKRYADLLCRYKINEWQLYVEHTFLFPCISEAWRDDTPLTAQDILELDAYCRARHIELVPSLSSFGHMYQILSTKTACDFCELPDSEKIPFSFTYWGAHHTLNVSNPDTMSFIKDLISQYRALFTSKKFNICCDETYDLGKGRSKALAEEKGEQELYVAHVSELCRWLLEQGITPQFWGDIMWRHPETYDRIPKGTICLNWGYAPDQREDEIAALAAMGATQYACPGVSTWNRWFPLMRGSYDNIRNMCAYAHKYHAIGLLNTDWGDYAHVCHPTFSVPGILYGAAFSWNSREQDFEELNAAISYLHYGQHEGTFVGLFAKLARMDAFEWHHAVHWMEQPDAEKRSEIMSHIDPEQAERCNAEIDDLLTRMAACVPHMELDKRDIAQAVSVVAAGVKIFNQIAVYIHVNFESVSMECRNGCYLANDLEYWFNAYKNLWRGVSRQSRLDRLQRIVDGYADMLRG